MVKVRVRLREDQEVQSVNVRVFKWNELLRNVESSYGLFFLRVKKLTFSEAGLTLFGLVELSNRDSIKGLVFHAIECSGEGCSDDTTAKLREAVSEYLLGCFEFEIQPPPSSRRPTLVIVVDVYVSERTNSTGKRKADHTSAQDTQDEASESSESVKKRKFVDGRAYKKKLLSQMQQWKLSEQEQVELRDILRLILKEPEASMIIPVVAGEPKGLSQVEAAVKEKEFDGCESEDVCSICLVRISRGMRVAKSPCSHIFHRDCLFRWLPNKRHCPLCRSICATLVQP